MTTVTIQETVVTVGVTENVVDLTIAETPIIITTSGGVGPQGPAGPPGSGGDLYYRHVQAIPAATWTITHNLGKFASPDIVDTSGRMVDGDIRYLNTNQVEISFSAAFAGEAYFN